MNRHPTEPARRLGRLSAVVIGAVFLSGGVLAGAGGAVAEPDRPIVLAQNNNDGFLPNIFGNRNRRPDDSLLRIEQLENQVRLLTGEIERLTFQLRALEARVNALDGSGPTQPPTAAPGTAAPTPGSAPAASAAPAGPIDLSRLNQAPGAAPTPGAAPPAGGDASVTFETARALHAGGRFAEAERELRAFLKAFPNDQRAGEAAFMIGDILAARGDHREAANVFLASYTDYPDGPRAPESLLRLGTSLREMGEREAACSSFEELIGAYPNAPAGVRDAAAREMSATGCG